MMFLTLSTSLSAQKKSKDTCFYSISYPVLDSPSVPHFDTTLIRNNDCKSDVIIWQSCGSEADYSLFQGDSLRFNKHTSPVRHSRVFIDSQEGKMDITDLPTGVYTLWLVADCTGGTFTIHLK